MKMGKKIKMESIASINKLMLNFLANRIIYEGEMPTNNALVKQNEPLQILIHDTFPNNIRLNCSLSRGHFPWKS